MSVPVQASYAVSTLRPTSYTKVAVAMHWLIAFLIFLNVGLGFFMETFPKSAPGHDVVLFYHASIGSLVFMAAVFRLFWRSTHRPPALPAHIPSWQQKVAHTLHSYEHGNEAALRGQRS